MVLKLNVLQRLLINGFMNDLRQVSLPTEMNKALKLVEKLAFKDEEQKELNVRLESVNEAGEPLPAPATDGIVSMRKPRRKSMCLVRLTLVTSNPRFLRTFCLRRMTTRSLLLENGPICSRSLRNLVSD